MTDSDVSFEELNDNEHLAVHEASHGGTQRIRESSNTQASYDEAEQEQPRLQARSLPAAASSWQEVDRDQLSQTVLQLISSVASTAPTDDKSRDAVWHPTTTITISHNLNDPLGFGTIDVDNMRLVREELDNNQEQQWQRGGSPPKGPAGQAKGAVGRFFSELRQGHGSHTTKQQSAKPTLTSTRSRRGSSTAAQMFGHLPANRLLPSEEGFDPEAYLAVFHGSSMAAELKAGLKALEQELGERTGQLKQLVKQNFERFISCKTTIDDIYVKLQRIESQTTGISTEILYSEIQEIQNGAARVYGPVLERSAKSERIRSVQLLLKRFQSLFSAPQRIKALTAARDYVQVIAEFKKANALIKPGPKTIKVWASLHGEVEKRVAEVYKQLQSEIQDPQLPAATASEIVSYMLQLQAEGLAVAQGSNPLEQLLAAREARFTAAMQPATMEHERALGRLRAQMSAAATDEKQQNSAGITDLQLLKWQGSTAGDDASQQTNGSSISTQAWCASSNRSRHVTDLAPLSGLQLPDPASRLVRDTQNTQGEELYVRHLKRLSSVLLDCVPGFWQAATISKQQLPPGLPAAATTQLQATLNTAGDAVMRLVGEYCSAAGALAKGLGSVGPLRQALLAAAKELAGVTHELRAQQAPSAASDAVQAVLDLCVTAGIEQLALHLRAVPAWLVKKDTWQISLTHSGIQPVTLLPEQLQEEVTVAMQYYQHLLACSASSSKASSSSTAANKMTKAIQDAYFACLDDTIKCCMAAADHWRPVEASSSISTAANSYAISRASKRPGSVSAAAAGGFQQDLDLDASDHEEPSPAIAGPVAAGAAGVAAAAGGVFRLSDDVKLLLIGSNLSFMRTHMVGSLTQRFLLVLTGEVASELERCSRYVVKLAGRLDAAIQGTHNNYVERKRRRLDRMLSAYIQPDGAPVGTPPELRGVSPHAQQLVQAAATVQCETYTYSQPYMEQLLHAVLEYIGSALSTAYTSLPAAAVATAGGGGVAIGAAGCPIESLAQYFMDLVYFDALLSTAGPPSLSIDLTAAYQLLASRICPVGGAGAKSLGSNNNSSSKKPAAETLLAHNLLAITDPQDLSKRLQVTCRKVLQDVLERSSFSVRSLLAPPTTAGRN